MGTLRMLWLVVVCLLVTAGIASAPLAGPRHETRGPTTSLKPDLIIGAAEGPEDLTFGSVSRIDLDAAGKVYVLDYKARFIRIFKNDGTPLRKISVPPGQGPREATYLSGIAVTPNGILYVNDQRKIIVYGPDGRFVRDFLVDFMVSAVGCPGTEELYAIGPHAGKILHVFDQNGKLLDSFGDTFPVPAEFAAMKDMPMFAAPLTFNCGKDGRIYVLNPHKYEVSVFKNRRLETVLKGESPRFVPIKQYGRVFLSTSTDIAGYGDRVFVALRGIDPRQQKAVEVFKNGRQVETLAVKGVPCVSDAEGRVYFAEEGDFPKVVRYTVTSR